MTSSNFETATNLHDYWLAEDCLCPVRYDVYFSLGQRYYCDAGCKICYIDKNFKSLKPNLPTYFPKITAKHEEYWHDLFSHFLVAATNDDMMFLKLNFPQAYDWYKAHASQFEYCMTDNAIFRLARTLTEIKFKNMANISISSGFAAKVNQTKLVDVLERINDVSPIKKLKFVDTGNIAALMPYVEMANKRGLHNIIHHDFNSERKILEYEWAEEQSTWIDSDSDGIMQIHREAPHIYFDQFFYSSDDASDLSEETFYKVEDINQPFDRELFLVKLIEGKQRRYAKWVNRTKNEKFKEYFGLTNQYKVNYNYNFIPGFMMAPYTVYCNKLIANGWIKTKLGLIKSGTEKVISIIERK